MPSRLLLLSTLCLLNAPLAFAWGPHPTITQSALLTLPQAHPLRSLLGPHLDSLTNLCWLPDHKRTPFPEGPNFFYADDYLLFPGTTVHLDHICPEVQRAYRPYFKRALQALRTETALNAARWIGSLLHFTEDTGSPPHAAQIRGATHINMENWVDATRIAIPDYKPQLFGSTVVEAENGFVQRMEELIAFSKPRGQRLATQVLLGNRAAVEPVVLECALETARVVADLLHTLGTLAQPSPAPGSDRLAAIEGRFLTPIPEELLQLPAKIMLVNTPFSTLSDSNGLFVFHHLPPGPYQLRAVRPGSGLVLTNHFDLAPGQTSRLDLASVPAETNFLRNGSFQLRWLQPGQPDFWFHTGDGWEGEIIPVKPGRRYRLEARFRPGAQADLLLRWSRLIPAEVPRTSPLPKIQSQPITPEQPTFEFTASDNMQLVHISLRSRASLDPSSVCESIRLIPLPALEP